MATRQELKNRSVKELKEMLSREGYDPAAIVGLEKEELVEKVWVLCQNPKEQDPYPLPLYSNCWPQFILRGLLLLGLQSYVASHFLAWHANLLGILVVVVVLTVRNMCVRQEKARKLRKRL
ncbi:unnamed protein product [Symbiodinium necroappetens]|uniref:Uncharacterized protein n=1 Tax=Symbiodinium necroappetens TaxID=1628268 RepID=A0A812NG39_9DINO|nr:unnamed protein product [Symbiodinium necroappetens]CAE7367254.1 unnamed protein product [Symbiodinium microadriaticum]